MTVVRRFEAELLHILHALLGRAPIDGAVRRIVEPRPAPPCLNRPAVALIQQTLATGCAWRLARDGGWQRARHLRGEFVAAGRLWERTPPGELGLSFSRHALEFLIWLTAHTPDQRRARWKPPLEELAVGDRLLVYFSFEALRETGVGPALASLPAVAADGLCRLAFLEHFSDNPRGGEVVPDFTPWVSGAGAVVLEALQPRLAELWVALERRKEGITEPPRMQRMGHMQERVLDALLDRLDAAGRRDLARFLLIAAGTLLHERPQAQPWLGPLDFGPMRLADRAGVYHAAGAFLRALGRLRAWEREARGVGYFDEGYAAAGLWKSTWDEHEGESLCERAGAILRGLDPLGMGQA